MSDEYLGCLVVFDKNINDETMQTIMEAIIMIKNVIDVKTIVSSSSIEEALITSRIKHKLLKDILRCFDF